MISLSRSYGGNMKKIISILFMIFLVFIFTGCELLDSLIQENKEVVKQIKDEDLRGYTVT